MEIGVVYEPRISMPFEEDTVNSVCVCVCVGCKMVQISPSAAKKSQSHGTHVYEIGTADIEFTKLTANIN